MYTVIVDFTDSEDKKRHVYRIGDTFPREGVEVNDERIEYLLGCENKLNTPVIEPLDGQEPPKEKSLGQMNKTELLEKATALGVEVPTGAKNDEIKALIAAAQANH